MDNDQRAPDAQTHILRVGVTGHRPNKLADTSTAMLQRRTRLLLDCLADQVRQAQASHDMPDGAPPPVHDRPPGLRFTTALAAGADSFAADAAIDSGFDLDFVLPFPQETYIRSQSFSPPELETFLRLWEHAADGTTRMELDVTNNTDDASAYVAVAHRILERTNILLAVWNGQKGDGPGGTAEVMALAMARGHLVIWLDLDGTFHLWDPDADHWQRLDFDSPGDAGVVQLRKRVQARH